MLDGDFAVQVALKPYIALKGSLHIYEPILTLR